MVARAFSEGVGFHGDETTIERRAGAPRADADDTSGEAGLLFGLLDVDEPFGGLSAVADLGENLGDLLGSFVAYLRAQKIADQFLPVFKAEALAFRTRFVHVPADQLGAKALDAYLEEARAQSLTERAIRNRRVACDAFLGFLRERRDPSIAPPAAAPPLPPPAPLPGASYDPSERRGATRVAFLSTVYVDTLGMLRCSDLSIGGMYLETVSALTSGVLLDIAFKLRSVDPEPVEATARVAFVHPQFGAGIEFVKISPRDAKRVADFVAESGEANRTRTTTRPGR